MLMAAPGLEAESGGRVEDGATVSPHRARSSAGAPPCIRPRNWPRARGRLRAAGLLSAMATVAATGLATDLATGAAVHSHVFIDGGVDFLFDETGRLAQLRVTWIYDPMTSLFILEDLRLDPAAPLSKADRARVAEVYAGDAYLGAGDRPAGLSGPRAPEAAPRDGRVTIRFLRDLDAPFRLAPGARVEVYDPTCCMAYVLTEAPRLEGPHAGCEAWARPAATPPPPPRPSASGSRSGACAPGGRSRGPGRAHVPAAHVPAAHVPAHLHDPHGACGCGHPHGPDPEAAAAAQGLGDMRALVGARAARPCAGARRLLAVAWSMGLAAAGAAGALAMGLCAASFTALVALLAVFGRETTLARFGAGRARAASCRRFRSAPTSCSRFRQARSWSRRASSDGPPIPCARSRQPCLPSGERFSENLFISDR